MPPDLLAQLQGFEPKNDGQRRISTFLIQNLARLSSLSLDDIAAATATSQPTVTRMFRALGYDNALALRTAAALHRPGCLAVDQVRQAAALLRQADDLYIYAPPVMDGAVDALFRDVFRKTDVAQPMKPQIQRRRNLPHRTANNFDKGDGILVLAVAALPGGYDFDAVFRHAAERSVSVVILQATPFEIRQPGPPHVFSLNLEADVHEQLATIHLASAVAEIRAVAGALE